MSRSSSRLSQRSARKLQRPKTAAPCLFPESYDVMLEEEDDYRPPRSHTSFSYYPEEVVKGEVEGEEEEDPQLTNKDDSGDLDCGTWGLPEDPQPLKVVKKYGYGYRKPEKEVSPHWSQWPQPPVQKPRLSVRHHFATVAPNLYKNPKPSQQSVNAPVFNDTNINATMNSRMRYGDERNIIMHRGLSPRRAAPPTMPGRSMTQYGGFGGGHRDYIGSLDLCAPAYNGYRGQAPVTGRSTSRESRPMHRHLRTAKQEEGYLHNNSIYYSTTPNVSGYFIIHPDWVSERLSMRRSQSLLAF
ncbi:uncharacterized protein LOC143282512 [Babylonia areolata]|uniref:uncharacterized protein LOC143282512 n=1 Tax=Babylonia areolata TaxID=304850 RepID=UPI003FD2C745